MSTSMSLKKAKDLNIIKNGDIFLYKPVKGRYSLPCEQKETETTKTFVTEQLVWMLDVIDQRFCLVSSTPTKQKLDLTKVQDSKTAKKILNVIAANCFTDSKVAFRVCCMDEAIFNRLSMPNKLTKGKNLYWLASSCSRYENGIYEDYIRYVNNREKVCSFKINRKEDENIEFDSELGLRIVVFLESDVKVSLIKKQIYGGKTAFMLST